MSVKAVSSSEVYPVLSYVALFLMAIVVFYAKGWFYLTGDIRAVVSSVPDDTAYFYKIAWNVVQGKGLTFDGINPTNGFQPLWLYVLLPLAWVMRDAAPEAYFRAALIYQTALVVLSGILLYHVVRQVAQQSVALITVGLFYLIGRGTFINGMETGILMLCLTLLLAYSLRYQVFVVSNTRLAFGWGLLAGLVLLARLDTFFLIAIAYAFVLGRTLFSERGDRRAGLWRDIVFSLAGVALVATPYFVYNKVVFGALMPISGQLKSSFPYIVQPDFGLSRFRFRDLMAVGVATVFCLWSFASVPKWCAYVDSQRYLYGATTVSSLATIAHYLNTALFMKWAVFGWHFAPYYLNLCLVAAVVMTHLSQTKMASKMMSFASAGAIAFALLVSAYAIVKEREFFHRTGWHSVSYEAAVWVRQNTPPNAILAMKDAGIFGLFSQRAVINLDGLVNNMEYQEALKQKRLNQYLAQKGVDYLVQHAMWDDEERNRASLSGKYEYLEMPYRSQRYGNWSDPVRLYREDEVFRRVYYEPRLGIDTVFLIWRLRSDGSSDPTLDK